MKEGKLIVCATPIGNLEDASPRLARALAEADLVACEDTRQTRKLLTHLGVTTRMTSYHEVGEKERAKELAERVAAGLRLALVSDAGMPAVSDPGYHLVAACLERGAAGRGRPRPQRRPGRAGGQRAAHRPVLLRGVPAPPARPARPAPGRAGRRAPDDGVLRGPAPGPGHPGGDGGGLRARPGRGGRPRAHQGARAGAARPPGRGPRPAGRPGPAGRADPGRGRGPGRRRRPAAGPADLAAEVATLVEGGTSTRDAVTAVAEATGTPRRSVYQAVLDARGEHRMMLA